MPTNPPKLTPEQARRKAAVLMVLLGNEAASAVFRRLEKPAVESLTREISELSTIPAQEAAAVLQEYSQLMQTDTSVACGGTDYAASVLVQTYGEDEAGDLLNRAHGTAPPPPTCLDQLRRTEPAQLARLLKDEQPQTIAVLLAHLGTRVASTLLNLLPEETGAEAIKRLAEMRQFSPEVAERIALVVLHKLRSVGEVKQKSYAGVKTVAEILNKGDAAASKRVLATIEQLNPELALNIRDQMFTFEDLISVPEAGLREWLSQIDKKVLALAIKGASAAVRNHVMQVMSSRAAEMLREDIESMGPVKIQDVTQAQNEAVQLARRLDQEGKMTLRAESNDQFVV